jgi:acetolactate synthase I/II/III large subunit
MNTAQLLVKCLEQEGVKYIFGIPGEENIDLMSAIEKSNIEFILTRHETGAAFMAGMVGRLTGAPGVCLSTLGPGATNLLTGVANTNMDLAPLVAITAQAGLNRLHKKSHQVYDLITLFKPVTKWNATVINPETTPEIVHKAFEIATAEKPGATHIELPEDIAEMEIRNPIPIPTRHLNNKMEATKETIRVAAELIHKAKKPLILCGNGVTRGIADQEVQLLAEKLKVPLTETFMGKGTMSWKHPLSLMTAGIPGNDYIDLGFKYADLIIAIGFDITEYRPDRWNKNKTPILHIDTENEEIDDFYPVSHTVIGDILENVKKLTNKVNAREELDPFYEELRTKMVQEYTMYKNDVSFPVKPQKILSDIKSVLNEKDIVLSDVGAHKIWTGRMFPADHPNTCLISNGLAAMGYALPSAIGAQLVYPDRKVLAIVGDGSFQMTGMELETAVRLNLPIIILLWRDEGYGLIEWKQLDEFGISTNVKFNNPDFVALAKSYGAEGIRINQTEELLPALERAMKITKPVLIDCPVDYKENIELTKRLDKIVNS